MGTPQFSVQTLEVLAKSKYKIECVYTQPPKKSSRGQKIKPSAVQMTAEKFRLNVRTPDNLYNEAEYKYLKSVDAYLIVVVAYGKIIPKSFLNLSKKGFINIHASLLPKWRGAAPIQRSIINQDYESGISIMKINEKLDAGPFMKQIKVKIDNQTTSKSLSDKLSKLGAENIIETINLIEQNKANFLEQNHVKATYAKKIKKEEAKINWTQKAKMIISKINGLNPSPGAWFKFESSRYKVWKAEVHESTGEPGQIIDEKLIIACQDKSIKILEIQKEGKKKLLVKDFLSGKKIIKGTIIQ